MSDLRKIELPSFYGTKAGMTRIFDEAGNHISVTVIKLESNIISQVKKQVRDGYEAYQIAYGEKRASLISKPVKGHLEKASVTGSFSKFSELRVKEADEAAVGCVVSYDAFAPSTYVDVTGTSKGKGFQGVIKRYHFSGGPAAHGSAFHRTPGSIGNRATPARVFKLKKLPGHMGCKKVTTQNLTVVGLDLEKGYMLIKGAVPGAKNSFVKISKALKKA